MNETERPMPIPKEVIHPSSEWNVTSVTVEGKKITVLFPLTGETKTVKDNKE